MLSRICLANIILESIALLRLLSWGVDSAYIKHFNKSIKQELHRKILRNICKPLERPRWSNKWQNKINNTVECNKLFGKYNNSCKCFHVLLLARLVLFPTKMCYFWFCLRLCRQIYVWIVKYSSILIKIQNKCLKKIEQVAKNPF